MIASALILAMVLGVVLVNKEGTKVLPIRAIIDKHTITPGYGLALINQDDASMRWTVTIDRSGQINHYAAVVDSGHMFKPRWLVPGDTVTVQQTVISRSSLQSGKCGRFPPRER